jgi:hypothetical protein
LEILDEIKLPDALDAESLRILIDKVRGVVDDFAIEVKVHDAIASDKNYIELDNDWKARASTYQVLPRWPCGQSCRSFRWQPILVSAGDGVPSTSGRG